MMDQFERNIDYARVSITNDCNMRCLYCQPNEYDTFSHKTMSRNQIVDLCAVLSELGIKHIRFTGGEPLLRDDIVGIVRDVRQIREIDDISMTTNGIFLKYYLKDLLDAGLNSLNISLDAVDNTIYKCITGNGDVFSVLQSLELAVKSGVNVKINTVLIKGINENQIIPLVELACNLKCTVRFIELMPIGSGKDYEYVNENFAKQIIEDRYMLVPHSTKLGNGPGRYYKIVGYDGYVGFISAMTHSFCDNCNRLRITSDGIVKSCLHYKGTINLVYLFEQNLGRDKIKSLIADCIYYKPYKNMFGYAVGANIGSYLDDKKMSDIGG